MLIQKIQMQMVASLGLILISGALFAEAADEQREKVRNLGKIQVGEYEGSILFQYPHDNGKDYRVYVAISKANDSPSIDSERIDLWLLAKDARALRLIQQPRKGPLIEVGSAGSTANAIYIFQRDVERQDLMGVVVSIDGKLSVHKIPAI